VSNVVNGIRNGFNALSHFSLAGAGRAIMDSFMSGLQAVWGKIQSFVGSIAGWIKAHKGPVSYDAKLLIPAGSAMMAGLNGGLVSGFSQVQSTVSSMAGSIARDVNGLVDTNRMGVDVNSSNILDQSERVQPAFIVQNSLDSNGLNTIVKSAEANDTAKNTYFR
jgi:phage-related protein